MKQYMDTEKREEIMDEIGLLRKQERMGSKTQRGLGGRTPPLGVRERMGVHVDRFAGRILLGGLPVSP